VSTLERLRAENVRTLVHTFRDAVRDHAAGLNLLNVYPVPDGMPIEHAATFPTAYLTAAHAMFDVAGLSAGETVMIHAAGSGVSVAAIQLAKQAGATVLATAGSQGKLDRALTLGADHVLNNREGDVTGWAREVTAGAGVNPSLIHIRRCRRAYAARTRRR